MKRALTKSLFMVWSAALVSGVTAGISAPAHAADAHRMTASNPLADGTQPWVLNTADRENLLQYVRQSKALLEKSLRDAEGLSLPDRLRVYRKAVVTVVMNSYAAKPRQELLMRYVLNQALTVKPRAALQGRRSSAEALDSGLHSAPLDTRAGGKGPLKFLSAVHSPWFDMLG